MFKFIILLVLLSYCYGQATDSDADAKKKDDDLEKLLLEIFGPPTTPAPEPTTPAPINKANEGFVENSVPQCKTAAGAKGQCTIPGGCGIPLSPLKRSDRGNCSSPGDICCGLDDVSFSGPPVLPTSVSQRSGCGWRNGETVRILSDDDQTSFAEFPWIVAVLTIRNLDPADPSSKKIFLYTCGGALIHPKLVLTTAHHVYKENLTLKVRAGEWDTTSTEEPLPYQDRNVERIIIHERFNRVRQNLYYDIALLVLDRVVDLAPNVNMICMPPADQRPTAGTRCLSTGWGKNKFGKEGKYQVVLKKVEVPLVDKKACENKLRTTRLGQFFKLHSSFMCAGGEPGKDTCKGDGGSPLMCPIPGQLERYMVSGMVAWGVGCGEDVPAVYVDVASLRGWVDGHLAALSLSNDAYTF